MYYRHYVLQIWVIADVMTSFVYRKWQWRLPLVRWPVTCVSHGACASRGWGSRTRKGRPCSGLKDPVVNSTSVVTLSLMWVWCLLYWRISLNTEHWKSSCFGFSIEKIFKIFQHLYLMVINNYYIWSFYFLFDVFTFCLIGLLSAWWHYFLFLRSTPLMRRPMLGVSPSSGRDWARSCLPMPTTLESPSPWIWTWMSRPLFWEQCSSWSV